MRPLFSHSIGISLGFLLQALPAHADVSAAQVWNSFKSQLDLIGTIAATETRSGNTLTVSEIRLGVAQGDMSGSAKLDGALTFIENSDGTVLVNMAEGLKGRISVTGPTGPVAFDYALAPEGFNALASGDAGEVIYTVEADALTHSISNISIEGEEDINASIEVTTVGLNGGWSQTKGTAESIVTASYRYDQITFAASINDTDGASLLELNAVALGISTSGDAEIPAGASWSGPEGFLSSGIQMASRTTYENFSYNFGGQGITARADMAAGFIDVILDEEALEYTTEATDLKLAVQPSLFMPQIDLSFAATQSLLRADIPPAGGTQNIITKIVYKDAVLGDGLWGLFDPQAHLPRSPMTLSVEASAEGGVDYLKDAAPLTYFLLKSDTEQPLRRVDISEFYLNAAGAELDGKGTFRFDNSDLESFDGIPRPEGGIDLTLTGGFRLLDNLAKAGLLANAQAQGIKSMAGFFTKPGDGPDTLTSKIEINKDGRILANGVPIQ